MWKYFKRQRNFLLKDNILTKKNKKKKKDKIKKKKKKKKNKNRKNPQNHSCCYFEKNKSERWYRTAEEDNMGPNEMHKHSDVSNQNIILHSDYKSTF
mgnify:CR=1 FL=1